MTQTLKTRLLLMFILFSCLSVVVVILLNTSYFRNRERVSSGVTEIGVLQMKFLEDFRTIDLFFSTDAINNQFFQTKSCLNLEMHQKKSALLKSEISQFEKKKSGNSEQLSSEFQYLIVGMAEYDLILSQLLDLLLERGFKDDGVIGEMRHYAHLLENYPEVEQTLILSLRRHEKDYIIRNEKQYISELRKLANRTEDEVSSNPNISFQKKDTILSLLENYVLCFNKMVILDEKIGVRTSSGLKQQLNQKEEKILASLNEIVSNANNSAQHAFQKMEVYYIAYFVIIFVLSIIVSIIISRRITAPLSALTDHIQMLIKSDFKKKEIPEFGKPHYEIEVLYSEFHKMIERLNLRDRQRDEAEKALRLNELKYRQLADMLPQCIFETNEVGNFNYVNKTWVETFGYSYKDVQDGLNLIEVIKSDNMNPVVEGKEFNFKESIGVRKDTSTFPAMVYSNSKMVNNRVEGYTGIIIDNTERKKYIEALEREKKKAEESDRLKSAFLANMSHEIRTPMNSIIGFTSLLARNGQMDKTQNDYIRYISQSGDMLLHIIDDIIDFAKIEAGELTIRKQECMLNKMLDDLNFKFREIIKDRGKSKVELSLIKGFPEETLTIITDPHRLSQILTNLLSNALKFTENGAIEFGYEIISESKAEFFVKDTGIGIAKKDQKIIFERFRQVDGSLKRNQGGTGLGLAITKNLVQLMGGKIMVESELSRGASFFVELPFERANRIIEDQQSILFDSNRQINWDGKTILIAEDNNSNFALLVESLKNSGVVVIRAHNGEEAISIVERHQEIEMVLMDVQMPVLNGYEATSRIKKFRPELPIIAQTAYALSGERERSLKAGCDDYLSKPINIGLLYSKMSQFLVSNDTLVQLAR